MRRWTAETETSAAETFAAEFLGVTGRSVVILSEGESPDRVMLIDGIETGVELTAIHAGGAGGRPAAAQSWRQAAVVGGGFGGTGLPLGNGRSRAVIIAPSTGPTACFYESQGLRLHYADWGNDTAPPLILIHGGRDHCRSWDAIAAALQPKFHIIAPDLRGHGDSDWAKGSSYSLSDYVYDLTGLIRHAQLNEVVLVGHSMGGMIGLMYAGAYPDRVSRLAVLDGVTVLPSRGVSPIHDRITKWVAELDDIAVRKVRRYDSIEAAAERMLAHNKRLTAGQALYLAGHGLRRNPDGSFSWKFDDYQQARAPYRLSPEEHIELWSRITPPSCCAETKASYPIRTKLACSATSSRRGSSPSRKRDIGSTTIAWTRSWRNCGYSWSSDRPLGRVGLLVERASRAMGDEVSECETYALEIVQELNMAVDVPIEFIPGGIGYQRQTR